MTTSDRHETRERVAGPVSDDRAGTAPAAEGPIQEGAAPRPAPWPSAPAGGQPMWGVTSDDLTDSTRHAPQPGTGRRAPDVEQTQSFAAITGGGPLEAAEPATGRHATDVGPQADVGWQPSPVREVATPQPGSPTPVVRQALPVDATPSQPSSSYGALYENPPYATEDAPMRTDLTVASPVRPEPLPTPNFGRDEPGALESVTCPECGAVQEVHLHRREAVDFCRRCDFPLFWTPARVDRSWNPNSEAESLRRLPGTLGSSRLGSVACPHCAELNVIGATTCVRCGRSMIVAAVPVPVPPPVPRPVPVAPPPPEPERGIPWWVWLLVALGLIGATLLVLVLTDVIG